MIHHPRTPRSAYTLIELLVVIAIITLLIGLTSAGVLKFLALGPVTETKYEIRKLQEELAVARQQYNGLEYLPSKLVLYETLDSYKTDNSADTNRTRDVLTKMFGSRLLRASGLKVDWNNDGSISTTPTILEGQQCLVFYLGGIPSTAGGNKCLGFSRDPSNPAKITAVGAEERLGPFYLFKTSKLQPGPGGFFSYADPFGMPYAFFGTTGASNSYIDYCPSLTGLHPYYQAGTPPQYFNPTTYQIISAGPDQLYGAGGTGGRPKNGTGDLPSKDNMTNFARGQLMAPE